jgi:hypothetical protein
MKRALTLMLLLFGMIAVANTTEPVEKETTRHCHHKAAYYAIRADLEDGKITIKQAQRRWQNKVKQLRKEEGK